MKNESNNFKRYLSSIFCFVGFAVALTGCDRTAFWKQAERQSDSLFLGISLGMDKQKFYDHCWELNRQKIVTHGPKNQEVEYKIVNVMKQPVYMRFYPTFYKDKIVEMPVLYAYEGWAPWNKQYSSDSLLVEVLRVYKKNYGEDFKVIHHKTMGNVYYKMDGKRRINLFLRDDQFVQAVFSDMRLLNEQSEDAARSAKEESQ